MEAPTFVEVRADGSFIMFCFVFCVDLPCLFEVLYVVVEVLWRFFSGVDLVPDNTQAAVAVEIKEKFIKIRRTAFFQLSHIKGTFRELQSSPDQDHCRNG